MLLQIAFRDLHLFARLILVFELSFAAETDTTDARIYSLKQTGVWGRVVPVGVMADVSLATSALSHPAVNPYVTLGVQLQPGAGVLKCLGMAQKCNLPDRKQDSRAATEQAMGCKAVELLSLYLAVF